jgi:hypothetical protein
MAYTSDTFKIYEEEYYAGYTEVLEQQALEMGGTNGGFVMETRDLQGNISKASFFESIGSSIITDRDPTDMTAASWNDLTMGETSGVRCWKSAKERKAVAAFRELGQDPQLMSWVLGQQHAKAVALSFMNSGLAAAVGGLTATGTVFDATATTDKNIDPENLVRMLEKMGDASGRVVALVMHSKMAHDLLRDQVGSQVSTIAGPSIYQGTFGSLGLPVLRTDSPALLQLGTPAGEPPVTPPTVYRVLALTEGSIRVSEDSNRDLLYRIDDAAANLAIQMTLEYSYMVKIKGTEWTGANYPADSNLINSANFNYVYADVKSGAGVLGLFQGRA